MATESATCDSLTCRQWQIILSVTVSVKFTRWSSRISPRELFLRLSLSSRILFSEDDLRQSRLAREFCIFQRFSTGDG